MNIKLWHNLRKARKSFNPETRFKKELWQKLSTEWQDRNLPSFVWYQQRWLRYGFAVMAIIVAVGSFSTGAYAYASPKVTEGTVLYPVKQGLEKIEEKMKYSQEAKAEFYLAQIKRREAEARVMQKLNRDVLNVKKRIEIAEQKLGKVKETLERKPIKNSELRARIESRLQKGQEILEQQKQKLDSRKAPTSTLNKLKISSSSYLGDGAIKVEQKPKYPKPLFVGPSKLRAIKRYILSGGDN